MARVLVTGGAGYVGAQVCKALHAAGHEPVALDNLRTGWRDAVRFGPLVQASLTDPAALAAAFAAHRPDAVVHCAALSQIADSVAHPAEYWRNNVLGSLNLIEAAVNAGCLSVVFSSTCAVYGDRDGVLLDESMPTAPLNPYAATKRATEDILAAFGESHGLRHISFRFFNVAGADPGAEIGERHDPETHLIPLVLDAALGRRPAITINGTDYPTPDGTCLRDYVHVCDLADAHVLGLAWLMAGKPSRIFNLGSGHGYSVRQVIETAARVTGREIPVQIGPRRAGDAASLVSGSRRATEDLGWRPQRSALEVMIADAWRWHLAPRDGR